MHKEELNVCVRRVRSEGRTGVKLSWNELGEGGGLIEGRISIIIHVLILNILEILCNIFPVFNVRSCFNECF